MNLKQIWSKPEIILKQISEYQKRNMNLKEKQIDKNSQLASIKHNLMLTKSNFLNYPQDCLIINANNFQTNSFENK